MYFSVIFLALIALVDNFTPTNSLIYSYVTCGSVIKLQHTSLKTRLHSHEVQYGSGSGQQSVTAIEDRNDVNSHWSIKGLPEEPCIRGEPVKCGSDLRLEHVATKRNLHSHHFPAPLSRGQEVSAFGTEGLGDTGDYWSVICDGDLWRRDSDIMFRHKDTSMYLALSGSTFGHPIPGQLEVCAIAQPDSSAYWHVNEGIFIKPIENSNEHKVHTEL